MTDDVYTPRRRVEDLDDGEWRTLLDQSSAILHDERIAERLFASKGEAFSAGFGVGWREQLIELYGCYIKRYARPGEREKLGRRVDPARAYVFFIYARTLDPYGDWDDVPPDADQVGREFFALTTDGVAVHVRDIPGATVEALEEKQRQANRAGWEWIHGISDRADAHRRLDNATKEES